MSASTRYPVRPLWFKLSHQRQFSSANKLIFPSRQTETGMLGMIPLTNCPLVFISSYTWRFSTMVKSRNSPLQVDVEKMRTHTVYMLRDV